MLLESKLVCAWYQNQNIEHPTLTIELIEGEARKRFANQILGFIGLNAL